MTIDNTVIPAGEMISPPSTLLELQPVMPVVHTVYCWLLIGAAWGLVAWHPAWWTVMLAVPVIGNRYYALFILGHDAFHNRIFRSIRANDLFANLFLHGPIGAINRINRSNHLNHHRMFASLEDPDRHKYISGNKNTGLRYLAFLTGLSSLPDAIANVFRKPVGQSDERKTAYRKSEIAILVSWQVLLIGGLSVFVGWWAYPVLWLVPVYVFTYLADLTRSFCEHSQPGADEHNDSRRLITYRANWFERMLFSPMNMNYHAAHHFWPSVPYYRLAEADRFLAGSAAASRVEWRRSYVAYLLRFAGFAFARDTSDANPGTRGLYPAQGLEYVDSIAVPACPVCGTDTGKPHARGFDFEMATCANEWQVVECENCSHLWLNPRPATSTLPVIYPPDYYAYDYEQTVHRIAVKGKAWLDERKLNGIIGDLGREPVNFLDVGCGSGRYLHSIRQRGLSPSDIYGLELDASTVERLRDEGYQVFCERVEVSESVPRSKVDLITMFHVVEHVDNPKVVAARLFELLAPGGCLAIETPNSASIDHQLFAGAYWGGYHFPRHWHVFSTASLTRMLQDAGFDIVTVRYQTGHSFWMYSFHHLLKYRLGKPRLARLFDPLKSLPLLVFFTGLDKLRSFFGAATSAVLVVARKPDRRAFASESR